MPPMEPCSRHGSQSRGRRPRLVPVLSGAIFLMAALIVYEAIAARLWPHVPGELNLAWHALSGVVGAGGAFLGVRVGKAIERRLRGAVE